MFPNIPGLNENELAKLKNFSMEPAYFEREACGLVVGGEVKELKNCHKNPADQFKLVNTEYQMSEVQAIWHSHWKESHPAKFTPSDLVLAHQFNKPMILYHPGFDEWDYYEPQNPNPFPLTPIDKPINSIDYYCGWRFEWGRSDCFSLVRRYFLGNLGIDIGEFSRPSKPPVQTHQSGGTWEYGSFWDYEKAFLHLPPGTSPQNFDIFGIALRGGKQANHLAVMVDASSNLFLHIPGQKTRSRLDVFDSSWRNLVVPGGHGRLKSLAY